MCSMISSKRTKAWTQENMRVGYFPVLQLPVYVMKGVAIINFQLYADGDFDADMAMLDAFVEEQGVFSEAVVQILEKYKEGFFPCFDPISLPQDANIPFEIRSPLSVQSVKQSLLASFESSTALLSETSGLKPPPKNFQGKIMKESILDKFKQAAASLQEELLILLVSMDFHDHTSMLEESCSVFGALERLFVDYEPFKEKVETRDNQKAHNYFTLKAMATRTMEVMIVSRKLLIDIDAKRVLFKEAGEDFIDFLHNFLAFPVGTVIRILNNQLMLGSLCEDLFGGIKNQSPDSVPGGYPGPKRHARGTFAETVDCGVVVCYNMKQYFQHGSINSILPSNALDNLRVEMVTQILNNPWSVISETLDAQCGHVEEQSQVPREHSCSAVPASSPADVETCVLNLDVLVNVAAVLSADFGLVEDQSQVLAFCPGQEKVVYVNHLLASGSEKDKPTKIGSSVNLPGLQCYTLTIKSTPKQQELLKKLVYHVTMCKGFPLEKKFLAALVSIHPCLKLPASSQYFNEQEHEGLEKYKLDLKLASKVRFVMRLVPK
ncbi:hypothetical protein RHGRI_011337 [Rhododendron griersonianum]|uniref:Uncharacterized protein n=1 Tax=Rhododendron griersonianum TaxID=479676 RepID=A0AAV6KLD7_9ERIC|nr:hypothetical protein RHGRI_011337 [Rhododendron griersonianum]